MQGPRRVQRQHERTPQPGAQPRQEPAGQQREVRVLLARGHGARERSPPRAGHCVCEIHQPSNSGVDDRERNRPGGSEAAVQRRRKRRRLVRRQVSEKDGRRNVRPGHERHGVEGVRQNQGWRAGDDGSVRPLRQLESPPQP